MTDKEFIAKLNDLPKEQEGEIKALLAVYEEIDKKVDSFKFKSLLDCRKGCGECCRTAVVGASLLEMQVVAFFFFLKGQLKEWMDKVDLKNEKATCMFYSPDTLSNGGHCQIYSIRPLLCRLFGFSARRDKRNEVEFMTCHIIREDNPQRSADVDREAEKKGSAPISMDYMMKANAINPSLTKDYMNINIAFYKAAERIGLQSQLKGKG